MRKARGARRLLVALSIVATGLGLAAPPAAAAPALTVTPSTGLLDGQAVTVGGTGFTPDTNVEVAQCAGAWPGRCQRRPELNGTVARVRVRPDGSFTVRLRLRRTLDPATGADQSCAASECAVAAVDIGTQTSPDADGTERARVGVDFEATGSAPVPGPATLAITPTAPARADQVATRWTGTGYDGGFVLSGVALGDGTPIVMPQGGGSAAPVPGAAVEVCTPSGPEGAEECERWRSRAVAAGSSGFAFSSLRNQPVRPDGTVDVAFTVPRALTTAERRIDCAVEGCRFVLTQDDAPRSPSVGVAWAPEWSPWPSAAAFVDDAYRTLVGRGPTASERGTAVAGLTDRSLTARALLRRLAADNGGRRLTELARLYDAAFDRLPDRPGLLFWEGELRRLGGNMNAIASAFGRSPEFRQWFGPARSDAYAVDAAYRFALSRTPSEAELAYWVGRLRAGLGRAHMIHLFSRTPEFVRRTAGPSETSVVIALLLQRSPTRDESFRLAADVSCRNAEGWWQDREECVDDVLLAVLGSDELAGRVD